MRSSVWHKSRAACRIRYCRRYRIGVVSMVARKQRRHSLSLTAALAAIWPMVTSSE